MKALVSFALSLRHDYSVGRLRLSRVPALIAWWWMLRSQRYIALRNLAIETPDGVLRLGLVVVSARGVFVIENIEATSPPGGRASGFDCGENVVSCYHGFMHDCSERARLIANLLEESDGFVSPVVVLSDSGALPAERPAHVVGDYGLVQYIRSFRVEVFSSRQIQQIISRLGGLQTAPVLQSAA